jgi:hypothetical protein
MNKVENNYFRDANSLVQGCFPQLKTFWVYSALGDQKNPFTEQYFPAKMQATSLKYLRTSSLM